MKNTTVICFANNKGGSGKTTTCSNVGAAMAVAGKKVLMIDTDMQMNLSLSFFDEEQVLDFATGKRNIYYAIKEQKDLTDYIIATPYNCVDLIPATTLMSSIEYELFTKWQRETILKRCLEHVKKSGVYDYILIDAPPTLGGWVMNILCASDQVILPVEASPSANSQVKINSSVLVPDEQVIKQVERLMEKQKKEDSEKNKAKAKRDMPVYLL